MFIMINMLALSTRFCLRGDKVFQSASMLMLKSMSLPNISCVGVASVTLFYVGCTAHAMDANREPKGSMASNI